MAAFQGAVSKKHIVWISPGFAANEDDSSCIPTLQDLAFELTKDEFVQLSIVALHYPTSVSPYTWKGIKVYPLNGNNQQGLKKMTLFFEFLRTLNRINKEKKIDVLHSFWIADTSVYTILWNFFRFKKHLLTVMGQDALGKSYFPLLPWSKFYIFSLSDYAAKRLIQAGGPKSNINSFGLPDWNFPSVDRKYDFISVGSIIPLKNHLFYLELLLEIKKRKADFKALIIGEQHDLQELERITAFIESNHLTTNVTVIGKLSRYEVLEKMRQSKILVHCAKFESQGMVMQEAIAMGCEVFSAGAGVKFSSDRFHLLSMDRVKDIEKILEVLETKVQRTGVNLIPIADTAYNYKKFYWIR